MHPLATPTPWIVNLVPSALRLPCRGRLVPLLVCEKPCVPARLPPLPAGAQLASFHSDDENMVRCLQEEPARRCSGMRSLWRFLGLKQRGVLSWVPLANNVHGTESMPRTSLGGSTLCARSSVSCGRRNPCNPARCLASPFPRPLLTAEGPLTRWSTLCWLGAPKSTLSRQVLNARQTKFWLSIFSSASLRPCSPRVLHDEQGGTVCAGLPSQRQPPTGKPPAGKLRLFTAMQMAGAVDRGPAALHAAVCMPTS